MTNENFRPRRPQNPDDMDETNEVNSALNMNEEYRNLLKSSLLKLFNQSQKMAALYQSGG